MLPLLSLGLVTSKANAQQYTSNAAAPKIYGFNVDEVQRLTAGTELNFSVYGTPGGTAMLRIDGAQRNLNLYETDAGHYEGAYTISTRDRITPQSSVTANLRVGNQVVSNVLSTSLQAHPERNRGQRRDNGGYPKITRFDVQPSAELDRGNHLAFMLYGTPGGKADVVIAGAKGRFFLDEAKSGEYVGVYRIKPRDRIASNSVVTANLIVGDRTTTTTLNKPLLSAAAPAPVARICANCGTVEAVNIIEVKGDGGYLGTIGGGVVGGLLGNQVGGGSGKTAATVVGVIGGALAGRAIEGNVNRSAHYEVLVRLQNGGTQTVAFETDPGYRVGDKVRINDGVLTRNL